MLLNPVQFHTPKSLAEASDLYSKLENVRIQAGGTFLLNALKLSKKKGSKTPENIISLNKIPELKGLERNDQGLVVKAMTTIDEIFESTELVDNFAILQTVCKNISTQPIRNMATVGGNLTCRYTWTEMPAVMVGLEATMYFIDKDGKESSLPAEDFFAAAAKTDKIFTHAVIPHNPNAIIAYQRVKKTQYVDIPMLSILLKTELNNNTWSNTRIGINNCVNFAQRDLELENFLNGKESGESLAEEALDHLTKSIYDTRSSEYKQHMFRHSIKECINNITGK